MVVQIVQFKLDGIAPAEYEAEAERREAQRDPEPRRRVRALAVLGLARRRRLAGAPDCDPLPRARHLERAD